MNTSLGYTLFELNSRSYFCISYKKDINSYSKLRIAKEVSSKL